MKIIVAGTPDFAVPVLQALLESAHEVVAVYTQPDRPKGRGRHLQQSPMKQLALAHGLPVEQPVSLKDPAVQKRFSQYGADIGVVVAYGLLLPEAVLSMPRLGCVNVHASLLPRWRGASPIAQAILSGDVESGVTMMRMVLELDAGAILATAKTPLAPDETSVSLHGRLAKMGAALLLSTLTDLERGVCAARPQNPEKVTYAKKIVKSDAEINWHLPATVLERQVRAYYGWPVSYTHYRGKMLRIWRAKALEVVSKEAPGHFNRENHSLTVACGQGALQIEQLQLAGASVVSAHDFLNAQRQVKNNVNYFGS